MVKRGLLAFCLSGFLAGCGSSDPKPIVQSDEPAVETTPIADWTAAPSITADAAATPDAHVGALRVTVTELERAYDRNEAAAQAKYGKVALLVTGKIKNIALDFSDEPIVTFATGNSLFSTSLTFEKGYEAAATQLNKGETRSFTCYGATEVLGSPSLHDCRLVE